jgi:hypothetical protein
VRADRAAHALCAFCRYACGFENISICDGAIYKEIVPLEIYVIGYFFAARRR